ncbi:UDP-N-acetylmuramate dehydrogenase [Bacillus sp. FJAT-50079]|uniref:UDP-N-acetylmuramate dehydrogenase n=1 Tax=Bacillus sp. FJAT-50079 TaxID=2833577 RepID=UPI001BCA0A53|nr:UDP-N-acetylmuramate dehydrogenase [Bacillus sp. FJAT-50079]MBS4208661.1 UDP-N-acetylmuramate dehydrogenase [Bacillus sp. FJAT-50079]
MKETLLKLFPDLTFKFDEPLEHYTYTKLGGKAECLFIPKNEQELQKVLAYTYENEIPVFVLGNGSNIIVRDGGMKGIVVSTLRLERIEIDENTIMAESGSKIIDVSFFAQEQGLTGLEFACGIPGSTGGAVFMNAGAYGGETKDVLQKVKVMNLKGEIFFMDAEELELGYRHSIIQEKQYLVLAAYFSLKEGNKEESLAKMNHLNELRRNSQPLEYPSCGSVFKRPPGMFAGKLIQDSKLQGCTIGGAQVSKKHAGFIVNIDNSTATDYISLIRHVQKTVKEKFDVELETEVRIIGENESL